MLLAANLRMRHLRGVLGTIGSMSGLITKLLPIVHVADPDAERRFYHKLGLQPERWQQRELRSATRIPTGRCPRAPS